MQWRKIMKNVCVQSLSCVWLFVPLWTVAHQTPLSMGFFSQEYWRGLPFPPPGNLPNLGANLSFLHGQADSLPLSHLGSPMKRVGWLITNLRQIVSSEGFLRTHERTIISCSQRTENAEDQSPDLITRVAEHQRTLNCQPSNKVSYAKSEPWLGRDGCCDLRYGSRVCVLKNFEPWALGTMQKEKKRKHFLFLLKHSPLFEHGPESSAL